MRRQIKYAFLGGVVQQVKLVTILYLARQQFVAPDGWHKLVKDGAMLLEKFRGVRGSQLVGIGRLCYIAHVAATGAYREQLLVEIDHLDDEITYWKAVREQQIADGKVTPYSRDVVVKGDHVRHGGSWYEVVRVNAKSVSVMSRVGGDWTDRLAYNAIRGLRTSKSETVAVVDGQRVVESGAA